MLNHKLFILLSAFILFNSNVLFAASTNRKEQFANDKVSVWETVIYPGKKQILSMHRHEHDRVLVAFDSGELKITNDKGEVHYLKLEKNKAYYLTKDKPGELHNDENMSSKSLKVLVMEFKD